MVFHYTEESGFLILSIEGEVRVNTIFDLKKELQSLVNEKGNLAVDLEKVTQIDSSGISLFINMHKKLTQQERTFCLFNTSGDTAKIFSEVNLEKVIKIYADKPAFLADNIATVVDELYPPPDYSYNEKLYVIKTLKCVLCGFDEIKGFILNKKTQDIVFDGESFVPIFAGKEGNNTLDIYALQVTVCPRCYFASRHINYFTDLKGEFESVLQEKEIHTLVREDGGRERLLAGTGMSSMDKFYPPYSPREAYWVYTLAEECAHTLYRIDNRLATFDLAYYNVILTRYCGEKEYPEFLRKAYMWYGEIYKNKASFAPATVLEACYYLTVISDRLKRQRDSELFFTELKNLNSPCPEYKTYLRAASSFIVTK